MRLDKERQVLEEDPQHVNKTGIWIYTLQISAQKSSRSCLFSTDAFSFFLKTTNQSVQLLFDSLEVLWNVDYTIG